MTSFLKCDCGSPDDIHSPKCAISRWSVEWSPPPLRSHYVKDGRCTVCGWTFAWDLDTRACPGPPLVPTRDIIAQEDARTLEYLERARQWDATHCTCTHLSGELVCGCFGGKTAEELDEESRQRCALHRDKP